jgi:hypothetical protein
MPGSVQLVGDLLFRISGISGKVGDVDEDAAEDDDEAELELRQQEIDRLGTVVRHDHATGAHRCLADKVARARLVRRVVAHSAELCSARRRSAVPYLRHQWQGSCRTM